MRTTFAQLMSDAEEKALRKRELKALRKSRGAPEVYLNVSTLTEVGTFSARGWELHSTTPGYANLTRYVLAISRDALTR